MVVVGHATQRSPQLSADAELTQAPPQAWKPLLQAKPQEVPSQVAVALSGGAHTAHEAPQLETELGVTHLSRHLTVPAPHVDSFVDAAEKPLAGATSAMSVRAHDAATTAANSANNLWLGMVSSLPAYIQRFRLTRCQCAEYNRLQCGESWFSRCALRVP